MPLKPKLIIRQRYTSATQGCGYEKQLWVTQPLFFYLAGPYCHEIEIFNGRGILIYKQAAGLL